MGQSLQTPTVSEPAPPPSPRRHHGCRGRRGSRAAAVRAAGERGHSPRISSTWRGRARCARHSPRASSSAQHNGPGQRMAVAPRPCPSACPGPGPPRPASREASTAPRVTRRRLRPCPRSRAALRAAGATWVSLLGGVVGKLPGRAGVAEGAGTSRRDPRSPPTASLPRFLSPLVSLGPGWLWRGLCTWDERRGRWFFPNQPELLGPL